MHEIKNSAHKASRPKCPNAELNTVLKNDNNERLHLSSARRRKNICIVFNTGKEFKLVFTGGENHAEAELASESELEAFNYICGSEYNFLKRPVVVMFGETAVAASIQCYPHGSDSVADNGMEGHVCLFFEGSLSHVGSLPDVEHNANVFAAAGRG